MVCLLQRLLVLCIVVSMISGCATTDGGRTRAEGTGFGALLGAAVGAGIGAAVGGKHGALLGTGIGTALGAGAGYVAGDAVAEKKQQYVENEDQLDGQIYSVVQCNANLQEFNEQTSTIITDLDREVAYLKTRYKAKKVKISEMEKKKKEIASLVNDVDQRKKQMNKEVIALNSYINSVDSVQDRAKIAKLGQEVEALKRNIAMLDSNNLQMAKLLKSLSVRK